jgi:hypothetical protein
MAVAFHAIRIQHNDLGLGPAQVDPNPMMAHRPHAVVSLSNAQSIPPIPIKTRKTLR